MRAITKAAFFLSASTLSLVAASAIATGCGSSDTDVSSPGDSGAESSAADVYAPPPPPGPGQDAGTDAPSTGCVEGAACATTQGEQGLCHAGICSPCVDPTDDTACEAAYGAAVDGGSLVCDKGTCAPGDCHTNTDCAGGKICGLVAPRTCGACASDSECKTAYGADTICDTTTGGCVTNAMACTSPDAGTCTGNPADICCAPSAGAAGACVPGNCCDDAQCGDATKPNCVNHVCTGCPAVADGKYYVDPVNGDDAAGTGSLGAAGCAFKTITKALAALGDKQAAPVQVLVRAGVTSLGALESFPLIVPVNVTVTSEDTASPATVQIAATKQGFVLGSPTSGLSYLTLDGQGHTATSGVVALSGSAATTTLAHVTVQDFAADGIVVQNTSGSAVGGVLAIGPAVVSTGNGVATLTGRASGLLVRDNGSVTITGAAGMETKFDANTDSGIEVQDSGAITLTGDVGATPPSTGTVTANGNYSAGVWIADAPAAKPVTSTITGLTAWNTTAGSGLRVFAGSAVKVRSSSLLGNAEHGVHVTSFVSGATVTDAVGGVDLGTNPLAEAGHNVLQAVADASPNEGAGVCLEITANKGQILMAQGNTLVTKGTPKDPSVSTDCSGATPGKISTNTTCAIGGRVAVGVVGNAANTNGIVTLGCTQ